MTLDSPRTNDATPKSVAGIVIPDSKLAHEITELVKATESPLLFHHSSRVYYWGALTGQRRGLRFDAELLYAGAMFHDMGLTPRHASADKRFEVDGANVARDFLRSHGIVERDMETVWTAIALHTTPGIPQHMHPVIALVTVGVEMDVLGIAFSEFTATEREAVVDAHPRSGRFKEEIIQAFYDAIRRRPETTFGNVKADVLADKEHPAGVAVPTVEDHGHVDIEDVAVHQPALARNAVTDDMVDRGANRFRKAAVIERRRDRIMIDDEIVA